MSVFEWEEKWKGEGTKRIRTKGVRGRDRKSVVQNFLVEFGPP